jgi:hypothetical protein
MNDLEAIRRLAAEPTDESVARTWYRITKLEAQKAPRKRRRLVPAVAGLAVVALIGASLVVYRAGQGVLFPAESAPEVVALLNSMADLAEAGQPVTVPPGQVVRTVSHGQTGTCGPTSCQLEPQDSEQLYDLHEGQMLRVNDNRNDNIAWRMPGVAGVGQPTLEWLASLPTDRQKLLEVLRKSMGYGISWDDDHALWGSMSGFYSYCEIALTPSQRANLLRALTGVTGLSVRDLVVDGVPLVAIRHAEKDSGYEIIFDPTTGHAVGLARVDLDETVIPMPGGPQLDKSVIHQVTWKQTITTP